MLSTLLRVFRLGCAASTLAVPFLQAAGAPSAGEKMYDGPPGGDPSTWDWAAMPMLSRDRAMVFRANDRGAGYNMHGYLTYYRGRFWAMWSSGIEREDRPGQQVRYATSSDGLHWSEPGIIAPCSAEGGWRYIARAFWQRDGKLLVLAAHDRVKMAADGTIDDLPYKLDLALKYFVWDDAEETWKDGGVVLADTINNFAPRQLPSGEWMMSRRDGHGRTSMIVGGETSIGDWRSFTVPAPEDGHKMTEPHWWLLADGRLAVVFRDQSESFRLYRAFSEDNGRTWSLPVRTNYPDSRAKFNSTRLRDGRFVLVSNPRVAPARAPLCISTSRDGLVFSNMRRLVDGETHAHLPNESKHEGYQYPNLLEQGGFLFVIYSLNQEDIEILRIPKAELAD